jgi:hypothetical protein
LPVDKVRFACVWVGNKYPIEYVERLRRGIARYYRHPHEFVCFTDKPEKVEGSRDISHLVDLTGTRPRP